MILFQAAAIPGMCIGAGTVLTVEQCKAAIAAGSEFVISVSKNHEFCIQNEEVCIKNEETFCPKRGILCSK